MSEAPESAKEKRSGKTAADSEARKCERYLQAVLRTTVDGFWVLDTKGAIVEVNATYARMSGYSQEELKQLRIADLDAVESPQETAARIQRIIREGSELFRTRHRRKDGSLFDVEASVTYMAEDEGCFVCFCRDISARVQTEDILAARLRLLEMAPSRSTIEIHRATLDEIERLTESRIGFYHHFHEDEDRLFLQAWSTRTAATFCRAEGRGLHYDVEKAGIWADCLRQRRTIVHNDFAAVPHKKGMPAGHAEILRELIAPVFRKGKIVAIVGIGNKPTPYDEKDIHIALTLADLSWDIAARRMAEDELIAARELAEEASRAKSEFLANVSHEIRTPMTVVLAALEQLSDSGTTSAQQMLVDLAENSGERLVRLIDDLLDFSRLNAGGLDLVRKAFDLHEVVGRVVQLFHVRAASGQVGLRLEFSPHLPRWVEGDADRLGQVLINLLGNAFKFTENGEVAVAVRPDSRDAALIHFSVRDTGIGIPESMKERIFESFRQVDSSLTRRHGGAGLGLSISRGLVELMGGTLRVKSREGEGSLFSFDLPLPAVTGPASAMPFSGPP